MEAISTSRQEADVRLPSYETLGVRVHAVQIPDVIAEIERWIAQREALRYVAVTGMHGVTEAQSDADFKRILNRAGLVVPDGMPLVWLGRRRGHDLRRRVYGPELTETFCRETGNRYRHFFYGGEEGVADRLARTLSDRYGIQVAGTYCPPFRVLTPDEADEIARHINNTSPDVVWVGLSTPKQERWMYDNRTRLTAPVAVGVGAAFDIVAGLKSQAPPWMRERGLEWLFRLVQEPKRLWRRYILGGAKFVTYLILERLRLKDFADDSTGRNSP